MLIGILMSVKTVGRAPSPSPPSSASTTTITRPGLNFVVPFVEKIFRRISVQNRAVELQFQAITQDQANVYFTAMMVYSVLNEDEETIKNVAFKFVSEKDFLTALVRSVEGSTRGFVATMRQAEILGLRGEIVDEVKENLDVTLETWGYHLIDLQLNDITFDQAITTSMAQVVASNNLKAAATNEGDALLIRKTKEAEAEGTAIRIAAEAERTAAQLRGQGVALFREEVARGLAQAAREMEANNVDSSLILFSMWTESIRHVAENGKGNVLFLDGSPAGHGEADPRPDGPAAAAACKTRPDERQPAPSRLARQLRNWCTTATPTPRHPAGALVHRPRRLRAGALADLRIHVGPRRVRPPAAPTPATTSPRTSPAGRSSSAATTTAALRAFYNLCPHRAGPIVWDGEGCSSEPGVPLPRLGVQPRRHAAQRPRLRLRGARGRHGPHADPGRLVAGDGVRLPRPRGAAAARVAGHVPRRGRRRAARVVPLPQPQRPHTSPATGRRTATTSWRATTCPRCIRR